MNRFLISAAHKSSGKTTISIGLCAALKARGLAVQPFKKGPDYIDPMWLSLASGRTCRNLDFYLMQREQIVATFTEHAAAADISLVEGNKGLYDGLDLDGSNSNAALANLLQLPVVLVIDARGMTRGIAPLILGYQAFDRSINIAGVILNNLGGSRHESKLRTVIEHYTDVPVIGAVQRDARLEISERQLGLMPSNESETAVRHVTEIGEIVGAQVNLDEIMRLAAMSPALPQQAKTATVSSGTADNRVRIGLARDKAFGFYYPDDLEALQAAGAELVPVDTLNDAHLPKLDGLFIGGGFPERFMQELEANSTLRGEIHAAIESGLPVYAECGGLMYLARSLSWGEKTCRMVGTIPGNVVMHDKPVGRGYVRLATTPSHPWDASVATEKKSGTELFAHEFHYSSLEGLETPVKFAYQVLRGHGVDGHSDGIVYKNLLACYAHLRSNGAYNWAQQFVTYVRDIKKHKDTRTLTNQA